MTTILWTYYLVVGQDVGDHDTPAFGVEGLHPSSILDGHDLELPGLVPPRDGVTITSKLDDRDVGLRNYLRSNTTKTRSNRQHEATTTVSRTYMRCGGINGEK